MFTRLLVPLDGSPIAEQVLPTVESMARLSSIPVMLVQVIDLNHLDHYGLEALIGAPSLANQLTEAEATARAYLQRIADRLHERGVEARFETRWGEPAPEIVGAASPGDLIVMATHGRTGVARALLGSVAEGISRRSPVPVMLVRAVTAATAVDTAALQRLLDQDQYHPGELARILDLDESVIRQAALNGQLPASVLDHHVISIARADAITWLKDGVETA